MCENFKGWAKKLHNFVVVLSPYPPGLMLIKMTVKLHSKVELNSLFQK